ncbi:EF-hand domain-containing protein [Entamoeba marina]
MSREIFTQAYNRIISFHNINSLTPNTVKDYIVMRYGGSDELSAIQLLQLFLNGLKGKYDQNTFITLMEIFEFFYFKETTLSLSLVSSVMFSYFSKVHLGCLTQTEMKEVLTICGIHQSRLSFYLPQTDKIRYPQYIKIISNIINATVLTTFVPFHEDIYEFYLSLQFISDDSYIDQRIVETKLKGYLEKHSIHAIQLPVLLQLFDTKKLKKIHISQVVQLVLTIFYITNKQPMSPTSFCCIAFHLLTPTEKLSDSQLRKFLLKLGVDKKETKTQISSIPKEISLKQFLAITNNFFKGTVDTNIFYDNILAITSKTQKAIRSFNIGNRGFVKSEIKAPTALSNEIISKYLNVFQTHAPSGSMAIDKLYAGLREVVGSSLVSALRQTGLNELVNVADLNGSGAIGKDEFAVIAEVLSNLKVTGIRSNSPSPSPSPIPKKRTSFVGSHRNLLVKVDSEKTPETPGETDTLNNLSERTIFSLAYQILKMCNLLKDGLVDVSVMRYLIHSLKNEKMMVEIVEDIVRAYDVDRKGGLNEEEVIQYFAKDFELQVDDTEEIKTEKLQRRKQMAMRMIDFDGNGTVEFDEVVSFVRKNIGNINNKQLLFLKAMFEIADVTHGGSLDFDSFAVFYEMYTFYVDGDVFDYEGCLLVIFELLSNGDVIIPLSVVKEYVERLGLQSNTLKSESYTINDFVEQFLELIQ